jgi:hypothetical protein
MRHIALFNAQTYTYCYCIDTNYWWRLELGDSSVIASVLSVGARSSFTSTSNRTRYVHNPESPVFQDAGSTLTMTVRTQNVDHGSSHRKMYNYAEMIGDTQTVAGTGTLTWSDDDYATFSAGVTIDMTAIRKRCSRLGSSRRRAWQYTETVNRPFHAESIELNFEVSAQ